MKRWVQLILLLLAALTAFGSNDLVSPFAPEEAYNAYGGAIERLEQRLPVFYGGSGQSAAVTRPEPCLPTATRVQLQLPAPKQPVALLPENAQSLTGKTGARFSRVGGAAGDFLVPGEATLQAALRDPALYGTRLTTTPTFNPALDSLGRVIGRGLNASVEIGSGAFSSRGNLIQTIIHEEAHIRLDLRAARGSQRAIGIQRTLSAEEAYVEAVAQRFWQRYGGR